MEHKTAYVEHFTEVEWVEIQ